MKHLSFKLIFRSWWRNKTFAVISILSLAVGIACTNLLAAFVIHEYNIEAGNPNRDRIYCLVQDNPYETGDKVFFAMGDVLNTIKERYPDVEDYLCLNTTNVYQITVGETVFDPITVMTAGTSFERFFPYQTLMGNLSEALTEPNKIALTEATARRFFGNENPIGQSIFINHSFEQGTGYQVVAVIKERSQSALSFDAITSQSQQTGGTAFLLMNNQIDPEAFSLRLKEDGIQTFMKDNGRYYLYTLKENLFNKDKIQTLLHLRTQNKLTLDIGLFSALLILMIACFNYINLNFSRLLQQVRMIYIQRLMGATRIDINKQLFFDIFFTVLGGFMLSLLIMYDLIPVFNSILSGQMKASFIFSGQVLPLLVGLILLLSFIPAIYISRKIATLSRQHYLDLSGGKKRKGVIFLLSVIQFAISIVLIIATLTVNNQISLTRQGGGGYKGLIELDLRGNNKIMQSFVDELRSHPELGEINTTALPLFHYGLIPVAIPDANGNETHLSLAELGGDTGFLSNFGIRLLQGLQPDEAKERYPFPVYVNQRFAKMFVAKDENPVGQPLKRYNKSFDFRHKEDAPEESPVTTIVGVVENFFIGSLKYEIPPAIIHIQDGTNIPNTLAYFRLDNNHPERLAQIKQIWEKHNPGKLFTYSNVFEDFITLNKEIFGLADILLMYSLISILLTCFGLFGIALYAAEQRTKEIGIRKVNGATTGQIVTLLNKQFIRWIGIAFIIAAPVSWILLNRWLQGFVYRTEISTNAFLIALIAVSIIALLTVSWNTYKAASANPVEALRSE